MSVRIAINGVGRIGRNAFRVALQRDELELAAVNDLMDAATLAHLLRYDSSLGRLPTPLELRGDRLIAGGREIPVLRSPDPAALPWADLGVDVVLECTGRHLGRERAARHLRAGAGRVVLSAPSPEADVTVVRGVNEERFDPLRHRIVSNASCTTNCLAPVLRVLHAAFGVRKGMLTTVHSYTNDQCLLDAPHRDLRRGRAAAVSMIPTTTGAAAAVGEVLPDLRGKLDGVSVRVPTPNVCLADLTVALGRGASVSAVNDALRRAAEGPLSGILGYTDEPLVSVDYLGCPLSAVVDGPKTRVVEGDLIKVLAWYDNEWAYANRLLDLAAQVGAAEPVAAAARRGP
ncbi:MAG: type I glyceraldehyde-3-phosphate dehydrogenase [Deferrisomatales bacterium]